LKNSLTLAATATALIALLSGCGSSNSNSSTSSAAASPGTTASTTASTAGTGGRYSAGGSTTASTTAAASAGQGVALSTKHDKLGTVLAAGPKHMTVYLFESDHGAASSCSGECANVWPPVTTQGAPVTGGGASSADIGTITRADGTKQVTYKGHPLYYYVKDKDNGDAYGQGVKAFGAAWYVLAPSGNKIDPS
jgi:predicted lipoprotein with Yx(FWY)xxD motif